MAEIPSADEIRKLYTPSLTTEENKEFIVFTNQAIARFINENGGALAVGDSIRFEFPALRDMGAYRTLWNNYHYYFMYRLRHLGYVCSRSSITADTMLDISLGKQDLPPPPKQNSAQHKLEDLD